MGFTVSRIDIVGDSARPSTNSKRRDLRRLLASTEFRINFSKAVPSKNLMPNRPKSTTRPSSSFNPNISPSGSSHRSCIFSNSLKNSDGTADSSLPKVKSGTQTKKDSSETASVRLTDDPDYVQYPSSSNVAGASDINADAASQASI